jgi:hypothetical protein
MTDMQASKILPGKEYAYRDGTRLYRFMVTAVVTRRERGDGGPKDYSSMVEGHIARADGGDGEKMTITPKALLGEYTEHQELVEREKREREEKERLKQAQKKLAIDLAHALYEIAGLKIPEDVDSSYRLPIRVEYSSSVEIGQSAIEDVLNGLRELRRGTNFLRESAGLTPV